MKKLITLIASLAMTSFAFAQDTTMAPATAPEVAPAPAPVAAPAPDQGMGASVDQPAIGAGKFGAMTDINLSLATSNAAQAPRNSLMGFYTFENMLLGVGLGFSFNDALPSKKAALDLGVNFEYFVYNKNGVALGPQITVATNLVSQTGDAFDSLRIAPGLAFWYTPWQAPIALGAAWDLWFVLDKNAAAGGDRKVGIATNSPSIRFAWVFP